MQKAGRRSAVGRFRFLVFGRQDQPFLLERVEIANGVGPLLGEPGAFGRVLREQRRLGQRRVDAGDQLAGFLHVRLDALNALAERGELGTPLGGEAAAVGVEVDTTLSALAALGFAGVGSVRQGKVFDIELDGGDRAKVEALLKQAADKLLANTVIENYHVEVLG